MKNNFKIRYRVATLLLLSSAAFGCSNRNLGDFDDTPNSLEIMPGPSIFADDSGKSPLQWNTDDEASGKQASASKPAAAAPAQGDMTQAEEQAEFEQFKAWNRLRTEDPESPQYQEFLQWMEYRKFKSGQ